MKITLNLATRPYTDLAPALRQLRVWMAVFAVLATGLGFAMHLLHNRAEEARARLRTVDVQMARVGQERQSYQSLMQRSDNALLLRQSEALNKLFELKAFSWTLAMENLETVLPSGVQVSTLEPVREKDGHISVHLRVIGPRDRAVDLVRNLEHSKRFLLPRIVGENAETSSGMGAQRLEAVSASNRFTVDIIADYNPPAAGERKPTALNGKKSGEDAAAGERKAAEEKAPRVNPRLDSHLDQHIAPHAGRPFPGRPLPPAGLAPQPGNLQRNLNPANGGAR